MRTRRYVTGSAGKTVGVEEEFLLTDLDGVPVSRCPDLLAVLPSAFKAELRPTQIEMVTQVHSDITALGKELRKSRNQLANAARDLGIRILPVGTPILQGQPSTETTDERYKGIQDLYARSINDYNVCACQVHVGVDDDELAVAVLNHLRPWLPILLAIGANSPYAHGADTGFSSWRIVEQSVLPGAGLPPYSVSADEYEDRLATLVDIGALYDDRTCFWLARRSPRYPTIEFRVSDAAATADDAILQAVLSRALVRAAAHHVERGRKSPQIDDQIGQAAVWTAARYGLHGPAIDPVTGESMTAMSRVRELLDYVHAALVDSKDHKFVQKSVARLESRGTGAARQRALAVSGLSAIVEEFALRPS